MKKNNFALAVYNEFVHHITWPKWDALKSSTLTVAISALILSLVVYFVDKIFVWVLKALFSFQF